MLLDKSAWIDVLCGAIPAHFVGDLLAIQGFSYSNVLNSHGSIVVTTRCGSDTEA